MPATKGVSKPGSGGAIKPLPPASAAPSAPSAAPSVPTPPADAADVEFRKGNDLFRAEKYVEAEAAYEAALAMKKVHDIAANLGYAELHLKKFTEAAAHLSWAVRNWPPTGKADKRELAVQVLETAKKEVMALRLIVARSGAEILVDGKPVATTPLDDDVFVEPGPRVVEAKLEGFEGTPVTVDAKAGGSQEVKLALVPVKPKLPPVPVVDEGAVKRRRIILIAGGAAAAVGLGLGIGFTAAANGMSSDADAELAALRQIGRLCPHESITAQCSHLRGTLREQDTFQDAAAWSYVLGGVAALGTLGYALWPFVTPRGQKSGLRLTPIVAGVEGGVRIDGVF